jgi:DNA-binding MarR family transcriptional regulator
MFLLKKLPGKKYLKKIIDSDSSANPAETAASLQFMKTASEVLMIVEKFLYSHELSHGRFWALSMVEESDEGLFPHEIAEKSGVSRATASGIIRGLEKSGYVSSVKVESDGRMKKIVLTSSGKEKFYEVRPLYYKLVSEIYSAEDKKSLKEFSAVLKNIEEKLDLLKTD